MLNSTISFSNASVSTSFQEGLILISKRSNLIEYILQWKTKKINYFIGCDNTNIDIKFLNLNEKSSNIKLEFNFRNQANECQGKFLIDMSIYEV